MRFLKDNRGALRVNVIAMIGIITTFIVWIALFTPTFLVIDMLDGYAANPEVTKLIRICSIGAGLVLICEVLAYLIWAFASAFKKEDQTYNYGGFE